MASENSLLGSQGVGTAVCTLPVHLISKIDELAVDLVGVLARHTLRLGVHDHHWYALSVAALTGRVLPSQINLLASTPRPIPVTKVHAPCGISALPTELLVNIFAYVLAKDDDGDGDDYYFGCKPIVLRAVCRCWRGIVGTMQPAHHTVFLDMSLPTMHQIQRFSESDRMWRLVLGRGLRGAFWPTASGRNRFLVLLRSKVSKLVSLKITGDVLTRHLLPPEGSTAGGPWLFENGSAPEQLRRLMLCAPEVAPVLLRPGVFVTLDVAILEIPVKLPQRGLTPALGLVALVFPSCPRVELKDWGHGSQAFCEFMSNFNIPRDCIDLPDIRHLTLALCPVTYNTGPPASVARCEIRTPSLKRLEVMDFPSGSPGFELTLGDLVAPSLEELSIKDSLSPLSAPPFALGLAVQRWTRLRVLELETGCCTHLLLPFLATFTELEAFTYITSTEEHVNVLTTTLADQHRFLPRVQSLRLHPSADLLRQVDMVVRRGKMKGVARISELVLGATLCDPPYDVLTHCFRALLALLVRKVAFEKMMGDPMPPVQQCVADTPCRLAKSTHCLYPSQIRSTTL